MKNLFLALTMFTASIAHAQTKFQQTSEVFKNGEFVWNVIANNQKIGEFWPIHGINLVTKTTDPGVFNTTSIAEMQQNLGGVAMAPDGMTGGSVGAYQLQGKCLSHGRPCGDNFVYQYGIIEVSSKGYQIKFTHKDEINNFDAEYDNLKNSKATLFFLPSIFRNGKFLSSQRTVDKVLIRRETPSGEQIGIIIFDHMVTYDNAREIITGLDRPNASKTTHIYVLDGGGIWGQSAKETNGTTKVLGTRDPASVTNYMVLY